MKGRLYTNAWLYFHLIEHLLSEAWEAMAKLLVIPSYVQKEQSSWTRGEAPQEYLWPCENIPNIIPIYPQ